LPNGNLIFADDSAMMRDVDFPRYKLRVTAMSFDDVYAFFP
jgi:hypothetical protein